MKKLLLIFSICSLSVTAAFSQDDDVYYHGDDATIEVKAQIAPPELPVYVQPPCPVDGYMWTPGYWAWAAAGYYWVPGVWVAPPRPGFLWTPGYWGFYGGFYGWHGGYWGEHIGYYGGVCYGYGYGGHGFYGGRWEGGAFRYNTAVWSVNTTVIHNTYVSNEGVTRGTVRASFNGPGGATGRPTANEQSVMHESHVQATPIQQSHQQAASNDPHQFASSNHGKPATAAMNTTGGQRFNPRGRTTSAPAVTNNTNHSAPAQQSHVGNNTSGTHQMNQSNNGNHTAQPIQNGSTRPAQNNNQMHSNQSSQHSNPQQHNGGQQRSSGGHQMQSRPQQRSAAPHSSAPHSSGGGGRKGR